MTLFSWYQRSWLSLLMVYVCGIEDYDFHHQQTQAMTFNINKFWMWFVFVGIEGHGFHLGMILRM